MITMLLLKIKLSLKLELQFPCTIKGDDGPQVSPLLRYENIQCHSGGEAVSVAWSTDITARDKDYFKITLEYTCYVNESEVRFLM